MSHRLAAAAAVFSLLAATPAAHAMSMSGTFDIHYDQQRPQPLAPDRVRIEESGAGINKSPGQPLDRAQVTVNEIVELTRGSGPGQGTITFTTPEGSATALYVGRVRTDAQGRITSRGTFRTNAGTGIFSGLRGRGSFTAAFTSQSDMTAQWRGTFTPPATLTSRR